MYIPIRTPKRLPDYVGLDHSSEWHTSALLETAVESVMLPSRMRAESQQRRTLNDLEAALNVNGNQRIARLQCSVFDPHVLEDQRAAKAKRPKKPDKRAASAGFNALTGEGHELENAEDLNLVFFPHVLVQKSGRENEAPHAFGQISSYRGNFDSPTTNMEDEDDDEEYMRKRRRTAGLPIVEKYSPSICLYLSKVLAK